MHLSKEWAMRMSDAEQIAWKPFWIRLCLMPWEGLEGSESTFSRRSGPRCYVTATGACHAPVTRASSARQCSGKAPHLSESVRFARPGADKTTRRPSRATGRAKTKTPPAGGVQLHNYHSATLPSSWRHTGLRQRWPTFAISRTFSSFTSIPRPGPCGIDTKPSSYLKTSGFLM
jgi:hypothetical protein